MLCTAKALFLMGINDNSDNNDNNDVVMILKDDLIPLNIDDFLCTIPAYLIVLPFAKPTVITEKCINCNGLISGRELQQ